MSDIVERLRQGIERGDEGDAEAAMDRAADRIERLEAALRAMSEAPYEQPIGVWQYIIRAALEGKP